MLDVRDVKDVKDVRDVREGILVSDSEPDLVYRLCLIVHNIIAGKVISQHTQLWERERESWEAGEG